MRVLHLISNPDLTHGGPVFEFEVSKVLKRDGIIFDYLITDPVLDRDEPRYHQQGSRIYQLPIDKRHGLVLRELKINRAYLKFFREHPYKIVYADTENALRSVHLLMARLAGVKVRVLHSHNTGLQTKSRLSHIIARLMRELFRFSATHYFACSDGAAQWLLPKAAFEKKNYTVLKNGVDLNRFCFNPEARARVRREWNVPDDCLLLGSVGRFMPQKNQKFLIEVLSELPEARLMLVGSGDLRDEITARAAELGVSDRLILTGNVPCVEDYLAAMDVFALASIFEGLGIVNIEAQANGLPCLMSDAVPASAAACDAAEFLPLSSGAKAWAEKVREMYARRAPDRHAAQAQILAAGYSIEDTAAVLRKFYFEQGGDGQC